MKLIRSWCTWLGVQFVVAASLPAASTSWPLPSTIPSAAGVSLERLDLMHRNLSQAVDDGKISGYITLLARDGKVVDWRSHGWLDIAAKKPLQRDSIVRVYSMSKIFTSVALLTLLEDGRLMLSDPVEKYLPVLKDRKVFVGGTADAPELVDAARPITIYDLLTHTSGYYYGQTWSADAPLVELYHRAKIEDSANLDEFVQRVALLPLHQQPGTRFRYGASTDIIGAVIEKVSGQRLDVFFQQRIFGPLGLHDTGFWVPLEKHSRLATVYERTADGQLAPNVTANIQRAGPDRGLLSGGGGLYSTAADYARFAQMLLNGGQLDGARIISRKTVELMTQNHLSGLADPHPIGMKSQGFGFGVRVLNNLGENTMLGSPGMFGWDGAATTIVQMDPKERTVAILLCQHFPYNEDNIFTTFTNGYYSALEN